MNSTLKRAPFPDDWEQEPASPLVLDQVLSPEWQDLALLMACREIAKMNRLTLEEQLHCWRPFDV